ncbi:hypothetical protein SARC_01889 [Sphaeroforma arctica JP610]|uniref:Uncharacterized protein n=1 Tax=Sphaeroforma arctica JP610 TaxID=667725 RepID=A0A0L0GA82_9EUKA|nr:hypothetical protein SARC_01889 [Sphaeroforma arctica JP610]KNC85942.1 hypothetical protein SARC_01889 [Sphaeroforma arctica JP610]|eukprot:XP_014159844.1 hypothetical protein SARC_01889 [Sphaeroforma arctica JP610]
MPYPYTDSLLPEKAELIEDKIAEKGVNKVSVEDLIPELTKFGRKEVPDHVKNELLIGIKQVLADQK